MFRRSLKLKKIDLEAHLPKNLNVKIYLQNTGQSKKKPTFESLFDTTFMADYKTKYPEITEEDLHHKFEELVKYKVPMNDPTEFYLIADSFGVAEAKMSEKERQRMLALKKKNRERDVPPYNPRVPYQPANFWAKNENGEVEYNWNEVFREFVIGKAHKEVFETYKNKFEYLTQFVKTAESSLIDFRLNWGLIAAEIGEKTALNLRIKFNKLKNQIGNFDMEKLIKDEEKFMEAWKAAIKDEFYEGYLGLEKLHKEIQRRTPIYQFDSYGQPYNFFSFEFLDTYEPEFRDWLLLKVEKQRWSINPKKLKKAMNSSIDEIAAAKNDRLIIAKIYAEEKKSFDDTDKVNNQIDKDSKESELLELLQRINEQSEIYKQISSQVADLKSNYDTKMATKRKKSVVKGEKVVKKKDSSFPDEIFMEQASIYEQEIKEADDKIDVEMKRLQKRNTIF